MKLQNNSILRFRPVCEETVVESTQQEIDALNKTNVGVTINVEDTPPAAAATTIEAPASVSQEIVKNIGVAMQNPVGDNIAYVFDMVELHPEIYHSDASVKALVDLAISNGINVDISGAAQKKSADSSGTTQDGKKTPFGKGTKTTSPAEIKVEQIPTTLKTMYNIEAKTPEEGISKLIEFADKQRANAQKAGEYKKKAEDFETLFDNMPAELLIPLQTWINNGDYKSELKNVADGVVDVTKDFDSLSGETLRTTVNRLVPAMSFSKEEFEDKTDPRVSSAIALAKSAFEIKKQALGSQRKAIEERTKEKIKQEKASVATALDKLKEEYEEFTGDPRYVKIAELLESPSKLFSAFYENDGRAKPDSAKRLMFALFGEEELSSVTQTVEKKANNIAAATVIKAEKRRSPQAVTPQQPIHSNGTSSPVVAELMPKKSPFDE